MKKAFQILSILLCAIPLLSGCDFFRHLAGRPDSAEIAAKAEAIQAHEAALEAARIAREDSLERVRRYREDSTAVMDTILREKVRILEATRFGGSTAATLPSRYYIIVGAFSVFDNAARFSKVLSDKGFPAEIIAFRNGYHAVGVCRTDSIVEVYHDYKRLKRQAFCPANIWILKNG